MLEASVFGRRAGNAIAQFIQGGAQLQPISGDPAARNQLRIQKHLDQDGPELVDDIAQELKEMMTIKCGIFRDEENLKEALTRIGNLKERLKSARIMDKSRRFNTDLLAGLETEHLVTFSEVVVAGALARPESRGAHSRTDYPERDDENWLKHTVAHKDEDGPRFSYKDVNIDYDRYPPQKRQY